MPGTANAGRPMLLEGGLKWQAISLSPADMDFAELKAAAARDIALAFGVPPMLLGLPGDATYANYREANRALWRLTLLPLASKLLAALSEGLATWFPRCSAGGRSRPDPGAGRRPRAAVGAGRRRRLPQRCRKARAAWPCRAELREQIMNSDEMVARLVAQAEDQGAELVTLRAIVEEASELGAERVLSRMGLDDPLGASTTSPSCASCCRPGAMPKRARGKRRSPGWCAGCWRCCCSGMA